VGAVAAALDYQLDQIKKDKDVDGQEGDANPGEPADDLKDLPGKEGSGDGECKELAPGFFKVEADAFDEGEGGVAESNEADAAQEGIVDERGAGEDEVDQARLGIETKMAGKEIDLVGDVLVEQAVRADADQDEEQRVEKLVDRDEQQPAVVAAKPGKSFRRRAGHDCKRGVT
jgi:hypothetical protein